MKKKYRFCTILNADGTHLDKISWQKAMTLRLKEHEPMYVAETHKEFILDSKGIKWDLPKTMIVKKYVKHKPRFTPSRRNIFLRDEYHCRYCGEELGSNELTVDHILPKSRGGGNTWENLATSCVKCNSTKGDRTPEEAEMPLRVCPNELSWR
jgi:hypothetical protein